MNPKTINGTKTKSDALLENLFIDDVVDMPISDDTELLYTIDTDAIDNESNTMATASISNLISLYNSKRFIDTHPDFRKRVDTEIESLRKFYKLSKTNEIIHDHLAQAIAKHPDNASLYTAMTKLQNTLVELDKSIKEILNGFNKMCYSYQTEITFAKAEEAGEEAREPEDMVYHGSKAFIKSMLSDDSQFIQTEEPDDEQDL